MGLWAFSALGFYYFNSDASIMKLNFKENKAGNGPWQWSHWRYFMLYAADFKISGYPSIISDGFTSRKSVNGSSFKQSPQMYLLEYSQDTEGNPEIHQNLDGGGFGFLPCTKGSKIAPTTHTPLWVLVKIQWDGACKVHSVPFRATRRPLEVCRLAQRKEREGSCQPRRQVCRN